MTEYFVALDGDNQGSGTSPDDPFRTVQHGVDKLHAGDALSIRGGVYCEHVTITGKTRIVIRSFPGEHAVIDGALAGFRGVPNDLWRPGGADGEYITRDRYPAGTMFGAFLVPGQYTRLITYSNLNDLRAANQTFGPLPAGVGPDGPLIVCPPGTRLNKRPWVYMGPGLYQGEDQHVHVRLSHTTLNLPGITDYTGPEDPRGVPLAIWTGPEPAVRVIGCTSVTIENLTVRFGGGRTLRLESTDEVHFDHLAVLAGPYALQIADNCRRTTFTNTSFDGGMPPWYFRSDRKGDYTIKETGEENVLGRQTIVTLMYSVDSSRSTTFDSCEFANAHDIQLNGTDVVFRRNWVHNINDDGIFVGKTAINLRISGNVFEKCLMALSVATDSATGNVYLHRNLIDLRQPTAGNRPAPDPGLVAPEDRPVMRFGNMFKSNTPDPEVNVFHNTVLIVQEQGSSYNLFRSYDGASARRAYNNILVGIDDSGASGPALAWLPRLTDQADTDGNCYFGIARTSPTLLRVRPANGGTASSFDSISELHTSPFFTQSQAAHPPGFEAHGTDQNPRLRRYWLPPHFPLIEDLRLAAGSPAKNGGVPLTGILREIDGNPAAGQRPDIGCYPFGSPPMSVGVDGLRRFPHSPVVAPLPPASA
jgi:hypothetical protein